MGNYIGNYLVNDRLFEGFKRKAAAEYHNTLKSVSHWEKFAKKLRDMGERDVAKFAYAFPHKDGMDNELKIEAYAKEFGYCIEDEKLNTEFSTYLFAKDAGQHSRCP